MVKLQKNCGIKSPCCGKKSGFLWGSHQKPDLPYQKPDLPYQKPDFFPWNYKEIPRKLKH